MPRPIAVLVGSFPARFRLIADAVALMYVHPATNIFTISHVGRIPACHVPPRRPLRWVRVIPQQMQWAIRRITPSRIPAAVSGNLQHITTRNFHHPHLRPAKRAFAVSACFHLSPAFSVCAACGLPGLPLSGVLVGVGEGWCGLRLIHFPANSPGIGDISAVAAIFV